MHGVILASFILPSFSVPSPFARSRFRQYFCHVLLPRIALASPPFCRRFAPATFSLHSRIVLASLLASLLTSLSVRFRFLHTSRRSRFALALISRHQVVLGSIVALHSLQSRFVARFGFASISLGPRFGLGSFSLRSLFVVRHLCKFIAPLFRLKIHSELHQSASHHLDLFCTLPDQHSSTRSGISWISRIATCNNFGISLISFSTSRKFLELHRSASALLVSSSCPSRLL